MGTLATAVMELADPSADNSVVAAAAVVAWVAVADISTGAVVAAGGRATSAAGAPRLEEWVAQVVVAMAVEVMAQVQSHARARAATTARQTS